MSPIVDQRALEVFIDHADLDGARRGEAALTAMAASVRLRVVGVAFQTLNRYLGVAVGEHLGYLFTGVWTGLVGQLSFSQICFTVRAGSSG